jgi:hypothetical protein
MKKTTTLLICTFFTCLLMAQTQVFSNAPYEAEWRQIDSLIEQELPQSAQTAVQTLAEQAEQEGEGTHVLKAKLYAAELQSQLEDEGSWAGLQALTEAMAGSQGAERAVLASILGQAYLSYAQHNQWQLRDRTRTTEAPTAEEASWTLPDFYRKATELFLLSLADTSTRRVQWQEFSPLVIPGTQQAQSLRPTLYDILLHRALDYFRQQDALVGDPTYTNTLSDPALLDPVAAFIRYEWDNPAPRSRIE